MVLSDEQGVKNENEKKGIQFLCGGRGSQDLPSLDRRNSVDQCQKSRSNR